MNMKSVTSFSPLWNYFSWLWNKTNFNKQLNINLPFATDQDFEDYAKLLVGLKNLYQAATLKTNPFVVVIYPVPMRTSRPILAKLEKYGIDFIDYSFVNPKKFVKGSISIPGEGHPTKEFNSFFADVIKDDLKPILKKYHSL